MKHTFVLPQRHINTGAMHGRLFALSIAKARVCRCRRAMIPAAPGLIAQIGGDSVCRGNCLRLLRNPPDHYCQYWHLACGRWGHNHPTGIQRYL